jgi:hypothetical protein
MFNLTPMEKAVFFGVLALIVVVVLLVIFFTHHASSAGDKKSTKESIQHDIATVQASIAILSDTSNITASKNCLKTASSAKNKQTLDTINTAITQIVVNINKATLSESDKTDLTTKVKALQYKSSLLHSLKPCNEYCTGGATYNPDKNECDEDVSSYNKNLASISEDLDNLISSYVTTIPTGDGGQPASGGNKPPAPKPPAPKPPASGGATGKCTFYVPVEQSTKCFEIDKNHVPGSKDKQFTNKDCSDPCTPK